MTRGRRRAPLALAFAGVLSACSPGDSARPSADLPVGTPLEIAALPEVSVGVLDGDSLQEFDRVTTPFRMSDGRLVVPQRRIGLIRIFDADGQYLTTLGRLGEGPGEFQDLSAAWPRADTIEAFDGDLLRITRFLPDDDVEVVSLEPVRSAQVAIPAGFDDGWLVYGVAIVGQDGRDQMPVHWFDRSGALRAEVTRVEGMWRYVFDGGWGGTHASLATGALGSRRST